MARVAAAARPIKASKDAKKTKEPKEKNKLVKPRTHPSTSEMVLKAIKNLADKKGSSLIAIKKYIAAHYEVDIDKQASFIRKFLKKAVESKTLVQPKGVGASGSFKLPRESKASEKSKKPPAKRGRPKKTESVPKKIKPTESKIKKSAALKKAAKPIRRAKAVKQPRSQKDKKPKASKTKSAKVSKSSKTKSAKK